jgi:hypothetical protein
LHPGYIFIMLTDTKLERLLVNLQLLNKAVEL